MKILFAGQLLLAFLIFQTPVCHGENTAILDPSSTLKMKEPQINHPNDQMHDLTYVRLTPVHPESLYHSGKNQMQDSIIDNDGNMYVTTWDLGTKTEANFLEDQKACDQKIYNRLILERAFDLSEIHEEDIQPSLFKEHGRCFISGGYALKGKDGFSPEKFLLNIFRSHLKSSTYMPVGAKFYIAKEHAKYIDAYKDLKHCTELAQKIDSGGIIEEYSDVYTYVSIKPYVESIESCLKNAGYNIETANDSNP